MNEHRFERGQALVLIVLSIIAIFGFAALAVDYGKVYAERRRAQSAADASALAAAYSAANSQSEDKAEIFAAAKDKALAIALENGYTPDQIDMYSPPTHGNYEECRCEYIQVDITSRVTPVFLQFVWGGEEKITTEAIARGRRSQAISENNAVHALLEPNEPGYENDHGVIVDGDISFTVKHGNIYSNKDGVTVGNASVTLEGGAIKTVTGWDQKGKLLPGADKVIPAPKPPMPACNVPEGTWQDQGGKTVYSPGWYKDGINFSGKNEMQPGLYCVERDMVINGNAEVKGEGIMIALLTGKLQINGSATVQWKRPNDLMDQNGNQWGGMLLYLPVTNKNTVTLTGANGTRFSGTVYAPKSLCDYGGNNVSFGSPAQLICHQVKLHGDRSVTIDYQAEQEYRMPPIVELVN